MGGWEKHLPDEQLREVRAAMVAMGLVDNNTLSVLLSGIDNRYAAALPVAPNPAATLQVQLARMNKVANLRNGDVPLAQYLQTAVDLAGGQSQVKVLEDALDQITAMRAAPPAAASPPLTEAIVPVNLDIAAEAMIGGADDTLSVRYLQKALEATRSVFRLTVHRHLDGQGEYLAGDVKRLVNGTGWMIGPRLLITNHHVINARMKGVITEPDATEADFELQAEHTAIMFDYFERDKPSFTAHTQPAALLASDRDLDFAILRIPNDAPDRPPLPLRRHAIRKTPQQALGIRVNLLQHPNGEPMRLGFRDNFVVLGNATMLSYLTDTAVGSSGSPVSDDSWVVAALHSGSKNIVDQNIVIRDKHIKRENFGIPMTAIMDKLKAAFPAVHTEVENAQNGIG